MKKTRFAFFAVAALALVACMQEVQEENPGTQIVGDNAISFTVKSGISTRSAEEAVPVVVGQKISLGEPVLGQSITLEETVTTMDGIYPLIAGAADSDKRQMLINHIKNDMMSGVGISAVDMSASYFATNGYWNGNVWFSHQWFFWKTMLDLGETDFAFKIAETALEAWKKECEYSYYTFEMVNINPVH